MSKCITKIENYNKLYEMKDGDIAIIMKWHDEHLSKGDLIQRYNNSIIVIGKPYNNSYPDMFDRKYLNAIEVLILRPGAEITVKI